MDVVDAWLTDLRQVFDGEPVSVAEARIGGHVYEPKIRATGRSCASFWSSKVSPVARSGRRSRRS